MGGTTRAATVLLQKQAGGAAVRCRSAPTNVGGDDYNLKLSGPARRAWFWLSGHGVDAARPAAKGYGKVQPVADNGTDFAAPRTGDVG